MLTELGLRIKLRIYTSFEYNVSITDRLITMFQSVADTYTHLFYMSICIAIMISTPQQGRKVFGFDFFLGGKPQTKTNTKTKPNQPNNQPNKKIKKVILEELHLYSDQELSCFLLQQFKRQLRGLKLLSAF